jgi:hypothetical protein
MVPVLFVVVQRLFTRQPKEQEAVEAATPADQVPAVPSGAAPQPR